MSYLYGDSTPTKLEGNYIEFLRDAVEFCVQLLAADQRINQGRTQMRSLEHATAGEYERLQKLGGLVSKSFEGATLGTAESATSRCAAAILKSASDLVRAEAVAMRTALDAEIAKREAQAGQERDGCVKALETLVIKHDLPEASVDVHLAISGGTRYAGRSRLKTGFGLDAVLDLEIPANHLFDRVIRVDRLMERLDVHAPEKGGWLSKEVKRRPQHLEKHHVTEFSMGSSAGLIKLRLQPDGTGPGFDVLFSKDAPRVRLARSDAQETGDPPFEVDDEDAKKLIALQGKLAAAALELSKHRRRLVEAKIDGEAMRAHAKQTVLAERLIANMAPVVQEIAWRSQSPNELVLRRLIGGDRREEIFLSKAELKQKIEPLQDTSRAMFDPLWVTAAPAPVPAPVAKGAGSESQPIHAAPPHAQTIRYRPATPPRGTPPVGSSIHGTSATHGTSGTHATSATKPVADTPKPPLDTPAGDLVRRTLIGATVESAIQNATATPPPVSTPAPAASTSTGPVATPTPVEGVSKTPLANPSHVESLRKEAAGTIESKQLGSAAKG
jgi:hypothetical protein